MEPVENSADMLGVDSGNAEGQIKRECPVPKPGGLVGQILGFTSQNHDRPTVSIRPVEERTGIKDIPIEKPK